MSHLDDEALSAYTHDGKAAPEVEAHIEQCEICRDGVNVFRKIDSALRGRDTWTTVDQARSQNSRLQEVLSYRRRIETEERDARTFLTRALRSPLMFRNAKVAEKPRLHTEGMVRVLCTEANARHEQRPTFSRDIAAAAYEVATKLAGADDRSQRNLMGMALREQANALRYLGRFKDALKLLDFAEKLFAGAPGADPFDLAIVQYIRATVYMKSDRLDDGIAVAREAAEAFRDYGDVSRESSAVLVEACCLLLSGSARPAAEAFERAIAISRLRGDTHMLARALTNCAAALTEIRELERAERYYVEALTLYDELAIDTEKTRVEWALAAILLLRGENQECARRLQTVRLELKQLGLTNDNALATLEWAEARLMLGQLRGVAEECKRIVVAFATEEMDREARHALALLNEALAEGRATPELLRGVRSYLERLPSHPDESFQFIS
jgi:tetratricopeptide (TPR) repeat protein